MKAARKLNNTLVAVNALEADIRKQRDHITEAAQKLARYEKAYQVLLNGKRRSRKSSAATPSDGMMTVAQVAAKLGCSQRTVRTKAAGGGLRWEWRRGTGRGGRYMAFPEEQFTA